MMLASDEHFPIIKPIRNRMNWNDWPLACCAMSTLLCLLTRRWYDASWSACFAMFMVFDQWLPTALPLQLHYVFLGAGVLLVVAEVMTQYRRYKKSLPSQ